MQILSEEEYLNRIDKISLENGELKVEKIE